MRELKISDLYIILFLSIIFILAFPISSYAQTDNFSEKSQNVYYDVASWDDMKKAYDNAPANTNVCLNVTQDIPESSVMQTGISITNDKDISINGNNHTLTVGAPRFIGDGLHSDYAFNDSNRKTNETANFSISNATLKNMIPGGLFQINGSGNINYTDIMDTNVLDKAARPFVNIAGSINLYGTNQFNMIAGKSNEFAGNGDKVDMSKYTATLPVGKDAEGEWVKGNATINVNGQTTVNQNWYMDQPFWYITNKTANLNVASNSKLFFNLNHTYTMAYATVGMDSNWNIGDNGQFIINGTSNTSNPGPKWYYAGIVNQNIKTGTGAKFSAVTAGQFARLRAIDTGDYSSFTLKNIGKGSAISESTTKAPYIILGKSSDFLLSSNSGNLFSSSVGKSTNITLRDGLSTEASTTPNLTGDENSFVKKELTSGTFLANFTNSGSLYTPDETNILQNAKYIHWYPAKEEVGFNESAIDRVFNVKYSDLPSSGEFSNLLSAEDNQEIKLHSSGAGIKNISLAVALVKNNTPDKTQYYWKGIDNKVSSKLNEQPTIISVLKSENDLPTNVEKGKDGNGTGSNYLITFDKQHGLLLKMNNSLSRGKQVNASLNYTLADAPN